MIEFAIIVIVILVAVQGENALKFLDLRLPRALRCPGCRKKLFRYTRREYGEPSGKITCSCGWACYKGAAPSDPPGEIRDQSELDELTKGYEEADGPG